MHGNFVWFDLMSPDPAKSMAFYGPILGWTGAGGDMPAYTEIATEDGGRIGGMLRLDEAMAAHGARPSWMGYIGVADADAAVEAVKAGGGTLRMGPHPIPDVGRFAIVADAQGANYQLFEGRGADRAPSSNPPKGHVAWTELHTSDPDAAFRDYSGLYGWSLRERMPMGPAGDYLIFAHGGAQRGGIMKEQHAPMPFWLFYFAHPDIDAAKTAVETGGGKVWQGPHQIPGGGWIIIASDPQQAPFALVGNRPNHHE